jgi:hypothetical protein
MNTIINAIERSYYYIKENAEVIAIATVICAVIGIAIGLIMLPFFA